MSLSDKKSLNAETHLHLYGCITAEDLYEIAKDRWQILEERLEWYSLCYEKEFGLKPDYKSWWTSSQGFDDFKEAYLYRNCNGFSKFQAKFNLVIALNPPDPRNMSLLECVLKNDQKDKALCEYRTFIPPQLSDSLKEDYFLAAFQTVKGYSSSNFRPLLALSLLRDDKIAGEHLEWLSRFLQQHGWTAEYLSGIDFCGDEAGHPPSLKKSFLQKLQEINKSSHRKIDILYHVGEMWDQTSLASAARWVYECAALGIQRLGHALALGLNPSTLAGTTSCESESDFRQHCSWLNLHQKELSDFGYPIEMQTWYRKHGESLLAQKQIDWVYTAELAANIYSFQTALLKMIRRFNPIIEVCPTSNIRIANLDPSDHPLRRFIDHDLRVTISSDDPGIFDITLNSEELLIRKLFSLSDQDLQKCNQTAWSIVAP
jgi:hypothetical protein